MRGVTLTMDTALAHLQDYLWGYEKSSKAVARLLSFHNPPIESRTLSLLIILAQTLVNLKDKYKAMAIGRGDTTVRASQQQASISSQVSARVQRLKKHPAVCKVLDRVVVTRGEAALRKSERLQESIKRERNKVKELPLDHEDRGIRLRDLDGHQSRLESMSADLKTAVPAFKHQAGSPDARAQFKSDLKDIRKDIEEVKSDVPAKFTKDHRAAATFVAQHVKRVIPRSADPTR